VCKAKNIELLPDNEVGSETQKPTKDEVKLSFGYQKEQTSDPPPSTSAPDDRAVRNEGTPIDDTPSAEASETTPPTTIVGPSTVTIPAPTRTIAPPPQPPSPWIDRVLYFCVGLLAIMVVKKLA
jgi:hypothetical protein